MYWWENLSNFWHHFLLIVHVEKVLLNIDSKMWIQNFEEKWQHIKQSIVVDEETENNMF